MRQVSESTYNYYACTRVLKYMFYTPLWDSLRQVSESYCWDNGSWSGVLSCIKMYALTAVRVFRYSGFHAVTNVPEHLGGHFAIRSDTVGLVISVIGGHFFFFGAWNPMYSTGAPQTTAAEADAAVVSVLLLAVRRSGRSLLACSFSWRSRCVQSTADS